MGQVIVQINGRNYNVACGDGEEDHLKDLAVYLDRQVNELRARVGDVGENRLLLMAALLTVDALSESYSESSRLKDDIKALKQGVAGEEDTRQAVEASALEALEQATARIGELAGRMQELDLRIDSA